MSRLFLVLVATLYGSLAAWCSIDPAGTSKVVGFSRQRGAGQSEFLTVYGGLEAGMALMFMAAALWERLRFSGLLNCFLIHVCLVLFRSGGFLLYEVEQAMTRQLAVGEWVLAICTAVLLWRECRSRGRASVVTEQA